MRFSSTGKWLVLEAGGAAYAAPATGGAFVNIGGPGGVFTLDDARYAARAGFETLLGSPTDANGPSVLAAGSDFAPAFATTPGVSRLLMSDNRIGSDSDLVLADADGGNRAVVAHVTGPSSYAVTGPHRARRFAYPAWVGNVVVYPGPPSSAYVGTVFDVLAVSADGKTTGILAPDVVAFDWVPSSPPHLFFVRSLPGNELRLWQVSWPAP
jgi:hypothetical protein